MATYFTGTSTGNLYQVGQTYSMGGNTYVANANGSFTNTKSGSTTVGSSQSSAVSWYSSSESGLSGSPASLFAGTQGPGVEQVYVPQRTEEPAAKPAAQQQPTPQPQVNTPAQGTGPGNNGATNGPKPSSVPGPGGGTSTIPVFAPGFGPKTKVYGGKDRELPIGFGLTWNSPEDMAAGQDIEDEMGEWGSLPFQIWKVTAETGYNAGRVGIWATQSAADAAKPLLDGVAQWGATVEGMPINDADRVNPFAYVAAPF